MLSSVSNRERAVALRRNGLTYSQILSQIPVAKSTLSLWFRDVSLSKRQRQRVTLARLEAGRRGGASKRAQRIRRTNFLVSQAREQIGSISGRDLFLIGVALYWAEGSKEKEYRPGTRTEFANSDPAMLRLFKEWLLKVVKIQESDLKYEIYLHETNSYRLEEVKKYWAEQLKIPIKKMQTVYYKKGKYKTNRKNTGIGYYGLIRIRVRESSSLNRSIRGWIEGICIGLGSGVTGNTPAFGAGDSRFET